MANHLFARTMALMRFTSWFDAGACAAIMPGDQVSLCTQIRAQVRRIAKIPTCIGIGPTKTIAKLANAVAKKDRAGSGICDLSTPQARQAVYANIFLT